MLFELEFTSMKEEDLLQVKEIYDYYILHSTATFHIEPITIGELKEYIYLNHPRYASYMIICNDTPAGFCYYTHFKKRQAYDRTAEVAIYLRPEFCDKGIGPKVLSYLEKVAQGRGFKNFIALVTGNNFSSIKLFERAGYKKVAHFEQVGEKMGLILDVIAFQKTF